MTKVLLIYPPYTPEEKYGSLSEIANMLQPLGIAYLGAVLEIAGFTVKIFDAAPLSWDISKIVTETKKFRPDFIGISSVTVDFDKAIELAKNLKGSQNVPIIIGGPHVSAIPEEAIESTCFDIGVIGEGEKTIVELINTLVKKDDLQKVKGIIFRHGKKIIRTNPRNYIKNLDMLPFPARHLMPSLSHYQPSSASYKKQPVATMITSRGCPNRCRFCFRGVFGNKLRFRSPENIVAEMEVLISECKAKEIRIYDDTFNADPERVKTICQLIIDRGLSFPWTCQARVDKVDRQMLDLMIKAGCWQISYGIESGNDRILANINKGITKEIIRKTIENTYASGIQSLGFFILGLPGETEATMNETIEFAKSLPLDAANFSIATPYPGTDLWFIAKNQGLLRKDAYKNLTLHFPAKPFSFSKSLTPETIQKYEKRAYKEFYRNPRLILRQLREIRNMSEFYRKVKAFFVIQKI